MTATQDWINQAQLAALLGITPKTASVRASKGLLRQYEHGVEGCGRKKYSRQLVNYRHESAIETAKLSNRAFPPSPAGFRGTYPQDSFRMKGDGTDAKA